MEDDFGSSDEQDELGMSARDLGRVSRKLYNDGYRQGKTGEEERQVQVCFDGGFEAGFSVGNVCGEVYARHVKSQAGPVLPSSAVATILTQEIMDAGQVTEAHIRRLRDAGLSEELLELLATVRVPKRIEQ